MIAFISGEAFHDVETEPDATRVRLAIGRLAEHVEDLRQVLRLDTDAGVLDEEGHVGPARMARGRNQDQTVVRELHRVVDEVAQQDLQLGRVRNQNR